MRKMMLPEFDHFVRARSPHRIWFLSRYQRSYDPLDVLQVKLCFDRADAYLQDQTLVLRSGDQQMVFSHVSELCVYDDDSRTGFWVVLASWTDPCSSEAPEYRIFLEL